MSTFSAAEVTWQEDAECNGASFNFTPDAEDPNDLEYVRSMWCNFCTVRTECLAYALVYHLSGYWGGTGTGERRLLSYHRNRVKCPICVGKSLVSTSDGHEICLHCGASWTSGSGACEPERTAG